MDLTSVPNLKKNGCVNIFYGYIENAFHIKSAKDCPKKVTKLAVLEVLGLAASHKISECPDKNCDIHVKGCYDSEYDYSFLFIVQKTATIFLFLNGSHTSKQLVERFNIPNKGLILENLGE